MGEYTIASLAPEKRLGNFSEVVLGLGKRQAIEQAKLYLQKEVASVSVKCPLGTDLFGFVRKLADGDIQAAFNIIRTANPFPSVTGRIFKEPEDQLHVFNKDGQIVSVRLLERFVGDHADIRKVKAPKIDKNAARVAVIGSGPAGLTAAVKLAEKGRAVTVFDSMDRAGGVMRYGYPEFRLPRKVVDRQIAYVQALGVEFELNRFFGVSFTVDDLVSKGYDCVLLATGAGLVRSLEIPGEHLAGVFGSAGFLEKINSPGAARHVRMGQNVVVIGGGNAAFDCARSAVRFGASVKLVTQGTQDDYSVRKHIVDHAFEEGVEFEPLVKTLEILGDGNGCVRGLRCRRYDYTDTEGAGEWQLSEIDDSDFDIKADTVIIAAGHQPNALFARHDETWRLHNDDRLWTEKDSAATSQENIFACGNITDGPGPVVTAMLSAIGAAEEIHNHLSRRT